MLDKNKGNAKYGECINCQFRRRAFSKHQLNFQEKGSEFINEQEVLLDLKQELVDYEEDLGKLREPINYGSTFYTLFN